MPKFAWVALSSVIICSLFAYAQKKGDEVVANIGNTKITLKDFNEKYTHATKMSVNPPPTKKQFLEELIRFEVGVQEAEKRNLDRDPIVRDAMRRELYKGLLEKELGNKVQNMPITEAEMSEHYKRNPEIRFSHILFELKPSPTEEQRAEALARANKVFEEVKKSKRPFPELVKLYSDDPLSKQVGGDAGWQSRLTIVPQLYDAALSGKVGDIKGLIETQFGFHIIKITDRRAYENASKRSVRLSVFEEKRKKIFDEYMEKLKKNYSIKSNPSLVE
ncbi:MAG: peptidylprolyl isomerase [Bdellovibrionaceae bacterium]|nr:peptidylprolyl isomerase [Pseudobdellovibrionaceae bacterium]